MTERRRSSRVAVHALVRPGMLLSHRKLSAWYRQLGQNLESGLPLAEALRSSRGTGAPVRLLEAMAQKIEHGGTAHDALRQAETWLPLADVLALSAAADAGRMPVILHNLSARHAQFGAATLKVVLACAYPLGVLHFALLLLPLARMMDWERGFIWSASGYAQALAFSFLPMWAVVLTLWILWRRRSPVVSTLASLMPALRGHIRAQALADFAFALGNFLAAGVPIAQAWSAAGLITTSRDLKAAAVEMEAIIARGAPPGPRLATWACFPPDFVALYRTGEQTGQLEANLVLLAAQQQEAANRSLAFATMLYPALMLLAVAGVVVYFVVSIYGGYLKMLGKLAE